MCGIIGIYNIRETEPVSLDVLGGMVSALRHRGPDETGAYIDDRIGLGQSRLSIIDLKSGSQPIANEDKSVWIIFNGEIFNYPELRHDLINKGHIFTTTSDTEVILHLYEDKQAACLDDLNGQFSFAIWDNRKKELFLARDRFGILPLYYTTDNNRFVFASEIKAVFNAGNIGRSLNRKTLDQIFTFWAPIPGKTAFAGINELPAGHYMKIVNGKIEIKKYWDFKPSINKENTVYSLDTLADELKELVTDSVRIRLRADVPVGSYLSGGLDSSGITALIKNYFNNDLRTFGIRFEESAFDEGSYQSEVVKHLNTEHTEILALNERIEEAFDRIFYYSEQPILRVSPVPLFFLSEAVNENNYKVVLTGEGADEIFGGYDIFKEAKIRRFWSLNPESQKRPELLNTLYPYIFKDRRLKKTLWAFFKSGIKDPDNVFFSHLIRWSNTSKLKNFFSDDVKNDLKNYSSTEELKDHLPADFNEWDYLSKAQYIEIKTFMSGYLLSSQGDRMAMAHSVELRPPYLDHRLADFMSEVPPYLKLYGLNEKLLLKKVYKDLLPASIVKRHKNPYRAPIKQSLLNKSRYLLDKYCSPDALKKSDIFNVDMTGKLLSKALNNNALSEFDSMAVAGIISTQVIYDKFVSQFSIAEKTDAPFNKVYDYRKQFSSNQT